MISIVISVSIFLLSIRNNNIVYRVIEKFGYRNDIVYKQMRVCASGKFFEFTITLLRYVTAHKQNARGLGAFSLRALFVAPRFMHNSCSAAGQGEAAVVRNYNKHFYFCFSLQDKLMLTNSKRDDGEKITVV